MRAIVYDTGALLAAERRNPDFLALHDELTTARIRPIIPVAVVLAQAWRGGPQHQISRVLKGCDELPDAGAPAAPPASPARPRVPPASWIPSSSPPPSATRLPSSPATPETSPASPTASASKSGSSQPDQHPEPLNGSRNVDDGVRSRPSGDTGHRQCGS
jgi:hypothetical protein